MASGDDQRWRASHLLGRMELRNELDGLLESLIPVLDSFDRLDSYTSGGTPVEDPAALLATCGRIGKQLRSAVAEIGLVSFGQPGDSVDLGDYRVIGTRPSADLMPDTVIGVVRPGYRKDGRIYRSAEVIVAEQPKESQ